MHQEVVWFIYGLWLKGKFYGIKIYHGRGEEHSVEIDWKKSQNPFVLGWMHTHPKDFGCNLSTTDARTMRSWVRGAGKPFICSIRCKDKEMWYLYFRGPDKNILKINLEVKTYGDLVYGYPKYHEYIGA